MSAHLPALSLEADPLIAEAKQRARRRRLVAALVLLAVGGAAAAGTLAFGGGGASGDVPWLPTRPQLGAANPPLAPACTASQIRGKLGFEGIGFGRIGGPLMLLNRGSAPCSLVGMPKLSFAGATSMWQLGRQGQPSGARDPLTPPQGSLRALAPGRWAATYILWANWCGRGSSSRTADPGQPPRALVLSAPGGGRVSIGNNLLHHQSTAPICQASGGPSILDASRFTPIVPQGPPSSALPLAGRIVVPVRSAHRGTWLSYTVVLTNRSATPFSFGRSCPAYEEGFGLRPTAYVLNCRAAGPIAPHGTLRFAMRILVPRHGHLNTLTWILGPHTWNGGVLAQRDLLLR